MLCMFLEVLCFSFYGPGLFVCHLWCLQMRTTTGIPLWLPLLLWDSSIFLSLLSSILLFPSIRLAISVLVVAWWKLHVLPAVIDWIMCFTGRQCAAAMCEGMLSQCVHKCGKKKKEEKAVSGRLTGWLLESFGRVDDHMQKAVQARSLLIWKTSKWNR